MHVLWLCLEIKRLLEMFLLDICKMYIFKTTLKDLCADTYENKNNLYHIKLHKVSADYTNTKSKNNNNKK